MHKIASPNSCSYYLKMEHNQIQKITSALTQAYAWVKSRRKQYPDADDVWSLRRDWMSTEPQLVQALAAGQYQFSQTAMMTTKAGTRVTVASASDACVLKALALMLQAHIDNHCKKKDRPYNCQGMGGSKKALQKVDYLLGDGYSFIFKTDIANYYASIEHELLYSLIRKLWKNPPAWVNLIYAAMKAGLYEAGHYYDTNIGIIKGSPLSYVLGSYYLSELDRTFMRKKSVKYVRYMDDIIILTKTRSALHRAIATCRGIVASLKLTLSHEKTYVGKTNKDFTFLGYCFKGASILEVAPQTITKSLARVTSLLEQQTLTKERLEKHVQGFVRWAKGGLKGLIDPLKARDALLKALDEAGINQLLALLEQKNINRKNRGILWLKESWPYRC